mgnify:CR=1 FL=1
MLVQLWLPDTAAMVICTEIELIAPCCTVVGAARHAG